MVAAEKALEILVAIIVVVSVFSVIFGSGNIGWIIDLAEKGVIAIVLVAIVVGAINTLT